MTDRRPRRLMPTSRSCRRRHSRRARATRSQTTCATPSAHWLFPRSPPPRRPHRKRVFTALPRCVAGAGRAGLRMCVLWVKERLWRAY
jgi:hypothetical protein